jgi:hypothetical protein
VRPALVTLVVFALGLPAWAEANRIDRVELTQYGLYRGDKTGKVKDAGTTTGATILLANVDFYQSTTWVPACRNVGFGIMFRPVGTPDGSMVAMRSIWRLPEPGVRNPDNGVTFRESISDFTTPIGQEKMRGYSFEHDWEMVTGEWTLEIWDGGRRLLAQTFNVYRTSCPGLTS